MDDEDRDKPWNFHTCKSCSYRSSSVFAMCKHVRQHGRRSKTETFQCESSAPEMLECEYCLFEADLKVTLQHHTNIYHEEKLELHNVVKCYKCKDCDLQTHSLLVMAKHISSFNHVVDENFIDKQSQGRKIPFQCDKSALKKLKCEYCVFETDLKVTLQHHINVDHKENGENVVFENKLKCYRCNVCNFRTYSVLLMIAHIDRLNHLSNKHQSQNGDIVKRGRRYKCERCLYESVKKQDYRKYLITRVRDLKWFKCDWCTFKSFYLYVIKRHLVEKHNIRWASCDKCTYKSKRWIYEKYDNDGYEETEDIIFWFKCSLCHYITKHKQYLKRHFRYYHFQYFHPNGKYVHWIKCQYCPFKTIVKSALTTHVLLRHYNVSKHSLQRHIALQQHSDCFKCPHCSFTTKTRDGLITHVSLRHEDKAYRFVCDYCSYLTDREDYFRNHVFLKHLETNGIHRYECKKCSFKTKNKDGLRTHTHYCKI